MTQFTAIKTSSPTRHLTLLAPGIAQALIALDYAIVYVALPTLAQQLGLSLSEMQWVVSLYGLTFAALLLLGGSLCDRVGARRIFSIGMTLFLLASVLGGLAQDGSLLLIARGGQGIAAALLQPAVLALMAQRFHGEAHRRALAIWSAIGALGLVAGAILGGVLTALNWRTIFFLNLPLGLLALWLVRRDFPILRPQSEAQGIGIGALVGSAAAGALVWALMRYAESGEADFIANRLAAAAILLFILHERYAPRPLLSHSLRALPGLQSGWLSSACYMASVGSQFYAMTLLWQQTWQQDAVTTGLLFTPLALLIVVGNALYTRLTARYASSQVLAAGFASAALGLGLLAAALTTPLSPLFIFGIVLSGIGHGLIYPAMFAVGLASVPTQQQGRASAVMITSQYTAGAMALAAITVLLGTQPDLGDWSIVFQLLTGAALIGMLIALCSPRR
ncbi:putative transport protein [Yersinia frederiksenii]|uniref:MFS transporter n=1 Tax=Yersinia alsatica TaxID=2890317 RepID=A0ABY5UT34_9GAMM|nr:MFS transporter [Yersinia alsatica]OWF70355.1 MFS transporter [Yersinia frederiksenii]UWM46641.1 MFS transporter [Yersinia alsatica]CND56749.1 putative transport protein [Yersinia frederiksenii]CNI30392.1 putative transport protein [Yersinia frederiksenii]CNI50650.1 putative transport protein [Yersinia frederiksenii]